MVRSQDQPPATTQPLPRPGREGARQQRVHDKYKRAHQVPNKRALCLRKPKELLRSPSTAQAEQKERAARAQPANERAPTPQPRQATPATPVQSSSPAEKTPLGIAHQVFLAQGGQQVRFMRKDAQWMARVTERIGAFSRIAVLPVVCQGHGDIEATLRALQA